MGSAVHGGAVLRQVVRHEEADDLDWGIIYYGDSVSKEDLESLTEYSKKLIPQLASKRGLGEDFTSCGFVCARSFNAPKITSQQQVKTRLAEVVNEKRSLWCFGMYFEPSFPEDSNIESRKHILDFLSELHKSDRKYWEMSVNHITYEWENIHDIETKHARTKLDEGRNKEIAVRVVAGSRVMSTAMQVLLESTGQGIIHSKQALYLTPV